MPTPPAPALVFADRYPLYLANRPQFTDATLAVTDKASGEIVTRVARAGAAQVEAALEAAHQAAAALRAWPAWRRQQVLLQVVAALTERRDALARVLAVEAGKPLSAALGELDRSVDTVRIAAEEAVRLNGEWLPLDISPRGEAYQALVKRVPVGPAAFITPFNFPLNLVAHKVAPALAVGCPFVLKPASRTPVSALLLGEILAATDLPPGTFSVLPCDPATAAPLVEDPRIKALSFTGSPAVGWALKAKAGQKHVALELGGNAGCIVDADADLDDVVARLTAGAFGQAGQSCISVQRVLVHADLYAPLKARLVAAAEALTVGHPLTPGTDVGPLISEGEAQRVAAWVDAAVAAGATVLCGGARDGVWYPPTWLEGVPTDAQVSCGEVFGPVATLAPFTDFEDACRIVDDSDFGLQAGVFTRDLHKAFHAFDHLEVGGVIINDIPTMRVDSMPYGGVKASGLGREGVRYAIEHLTERRSLVLRHAGRLG